MVYIDRLDLRLGPQLNVLLGPRIGVYDVYEVILRYKFCIGSGVGGGRKGRSLRES